MFTLKRVAKNTADEKIEKIISILYPPRKIDTINDIKVQIEYGADYNLEAALTDLELGHNDEVSRKTLREVCDRLHAVRKILEAYVELDKEAQYMIVDNFGKDPENILAME
jgi:formylmethanofuran dehydrogenase subunit B